MPSMRHEALRMLFENRPVLVAELLAEVFRVAVPAFSQAKVQRADLTQTTPVEYRADAVVVLGNPKPVLSVIVEVQLGREPEKRWVWPLYAMAERARHRCPALVLVVAVDKAIARWAAEPIAQGPPGSWFYPLVLGPKGIPAIVKPAEVRRCPELAVLSALAHGRDAKAWNVQAGERVVRALGKLDEERRTLYTDLIVTSLAGGVRARLEALMLEGYEYQSKFAKTYFNRGVKEGLEQGIEKGIEKGIEQGIEKGIEKGIEEGRADEAIRAVATVLHARQVPLSAGQQRRLATCRDLPTLEGWLTRAVTVTSAKDLFVSRERPAGAPARRTGRTR